MWPRQMRTAYQRVVPPQEEAWRKRSSTFSRGGGDLRQPPQGSVDGALVQQDFIPAHLLDAPDNLLAMRRTQSVKGAEDLEIRRPLESFVRR